MKRVSLPHRRLANKARLKSHVPNDHSLNFLGIIIEAIIVYFHHKTDSFPSYLTSYLNDGAGALKSFLALTLQ